MVVYRLECNQCGKFYIGNTQQKIKTRLSQHCSSIRTLLERNVPSNTFVRHMANHLREEQHQYSPSNIRERIKVEFLWQGNAISCMKSFGTLRCQLCMEEKLAILRANWEQPNLLMNSVNEIDEGCKHRCRFHRLCKSAD